MCYHPGGKQRNHPSSFRKPVKNLLYVVAAPAESRVDCSDCPGVRLNADFATGVQARLRHNLAAVAAGRAAGPEIVDTAAVVGEGGIADY